MRILHYLHGRCSLESPHGVDKTVYYLSREQAREGATTAVFCLSNKAVKGIPGVQVENFPPPRNPFSLETGLREAVIAWRPDFLHLHSSYQISNQPVARLARELNIPYAVTAHGNLSPRLLRRNFLLKLPYKWLFEQPFFNGAAFVHAISDMADIRRYGITRPLVIAPNGFERSDVPDPLDPSRAHAAFPGLAGHEVLLFLGRLDTEQKGLDLLLRAFAKVAPSRPSARLALAGPDWKGSLARLQSLARELGIETMVTFCGAVTGDAKYHLMAAAAVFVHASRWEAGIPFSVLEALATGVPCLLTVDADPDRLVEKHGAGATTAADPDTLARDILKLLDAGPAERHLMSCRACDLIDSAFRWDKSARILLEAYSRFARPEGGGETGAGDPAATVHTSSSHT